MKSTPDQPQYRIAVIGSGAVGCYYGAMLARHGRDVHFLMRSDLDHVREHGLRIRSAQGDFHLGEVNAYGTTGEIGPCDLVVIALKATSNGALDALVPPLLREGTMLLTLQNGLGNEEYLAAKFGAERVLGGMCFVCLNRTAPGVIEHYGQGQIAIGEFGRTPRARIHEVAGEFRSCGVECRVVESLARETWKKLVWNVPFNGLAIAGGGIDTGRILASEPLAELARDLMREVVGVARALGHELPDSLVEEQITRTEPMGPYKPSSLIDYLDGREVEVEAIWGEAWRQGKDAGAEVGRLETLYHLIQHLSAKGREAR
ncbi:putative 2-dehydropantoate 2-reductase [soil metagenome]